MQRLRPKTQTCERLPQQQRHRQIDAAATAQVATVQEAAATAGAAAQAGQPAAGAHLAPAPKASEVIPH